MEKLADFAGILLKNLGQISSEYKKKLILRKISGQRKKEIGFVLFSQTFLMKQNGNFANFLFFFWGWGGGGMMSVSLCNSKNIRNIDFL